MLVKSFFISCSVYALASNIERRAIGIAGDIFIARFSDNQNVMFAVSACTRLALWYRQHGFHGYHHAWHKDRINILAQFQTGLTSIIMRQNPE